MLIDSLDRMIISLLRKDARLSYRAIAREIGVSTPTVIKRIRKLKDAGIIKGFTVKVQGEPAEGVLFIISGEDARSLEKRIPSVIGVKEVMRTSSGGLIILSEREATDEIKKVCEGKNVRLMSYNIISSERHHNLKARCAYCRSVMDNAISVSAGGRKYYVCCPVCARELQAKVKGMKLMSGE